MRVAALAMLIVAAITLAGQYPVLRAGAICFDDSEYLIENKVVRHPSAAGAWRLLTEVLEPSTVHGYYQPLTMISLMVDAALGGEPGNLRPFHRTSLMLHAINAAMVTLLLYTLFGHAWAAGIIGVLFGLHPMTVETIAWVGERKTVLAAFFALPAILCYVRYARTGKVTWYAGCTVLFVLALISKPTATPLPVCFLLLDVWPLNRISRKAVVEKIPLLAIAAVSAWITYESQKRTAITILPGEGNWWHVPLILCHNIVFYLQRIVWPAHPSAHYPMPTDIALREPMFLIGIIGTAVLIVVLMASLRWTRAAAIGWLLFFVAIFPTMGVIGFTNVIAADKFAYLPSVGLILPLTALIVWGWDRARWPSLAVRRGAVTGIACVASVGLLLCSRAYIREWSDTVRLFRYMVGRTPDAPTVRLFLGKALADRGQKDEAIQQYRITLEKAPTFWMAHMNLGLLLADREQFKEAIQHQREALRYKPEFYEAHNNLGNALMETGDQTGAIRHYREALKIRPDAADTHYNLANALLAKDDTHGAAQEYELALKYEPAHAQAHKNYGTVLLIMRRKAEAAVQYQESLRLRPDWWDVANQLAWIHADSADATLYNLPEALRYAEIACKISGRQKPTPLGTLAVMLARNGRTTEARQVGGEAIRLAKLAGKDDLAGQIESQLGKALAGSKPATR